jgi:hypothetical protein
MCGIVLAIFGIKQIAMGLKNASKQFPPKNMLNITFFEIREKNI